MCGFLDLFGLILALWYLQYKYLVAVLNGFSTSWLPLLCDWPTIGWSHPWGWSCPFGYLSKCIKIQLYNFDMLNGLQLPDKPAESAAMCVEFLSFGLCLRICLDTYHTTPLKCLTRVSFLMLKFFISNKLISKQELCVLPTIRLQMVDLNAWGLTTGFLRRVHNWHHAPSYCSMLSSLLHSHSTEFGSSFIESSLQLCRIITVICCVADFRYRFYDGPPFATGLPHYGHILAGTVKDIVTRWAHQSGFHVERRFGWDCHGLPVVGCQYFCFFIKIWPIADNYFSISMQCVCICLLSVYPWFRIVVSCPVKLLT